jgi:PAS domain S-box-containing protein
VAAEDAFQCDEEKASAAMNAYCSESGVSREDIEMALQALSLSKTELVPVFAIKAATPGRAGRVIFASEPMLALFRAADLDQLSARLFESADPGARRLAELSRSLPDESGPRLERLRFFFGPLVESVTFLCRKYAIGREGPLLIAAALGARTQRQTDAPAASAVTSVTPAAAALPVGVMSMDEVKRTLASRLNESKTVRFLWRTDAKDKITEITPPLIEVVGAAAADVLGRDFGDVAKYLEQEPDGPLAQAIAKRETFSGIEVLWPIASAAAAVPVSLGALPAFLPDRGFDGYRGFGVIRLDRIAAAEPRVFMADPVPAEIATKPLADNVVPLRPFGLVTKPVAAEKLEKPSLLERHARRVGPLSDEEETAFREIAAALAEEAAKPEAEKPEAEKPDSAKLDSEWPVMADPPRSTEAAALISARPSTETSIGVNLGRNAPMIFDRLGLGILISRDDVPIYANRYLLDFLGYADEDALHAGGGMARVFEQMRSGGEAVGLRTASGAIAAVHGRIQTIDWDGLPATLLTLRSDDEKEQRSRIETELKALKLESAERAAILDTASDGIVLIDGQGKIISLNHSGEVLFGYDAKEVVGQPFTMLVASESQAKAQQYFEGLRDNRVARLLNDGREIIGQARQGGTIPLFLTLGRIGNGTDEKYCALMRDITQWKKVEQDLDAARREAERASALKSDFLAKVSHEIRTPLNAILGFAEVIMEERFGPIGNERYRDYLKDIHASGAHVMSLVNDLLDLSKIEAGRMDLDFIAVDPNRVISECTAIMQPQANRERVIMRLALAANLPKILADERSLRQIILNLLSNAVKFNEPGGQVIISSAVTDDGYAVIRIRDTGIGMSEDDISTALEPFRQLASARQSGGTGLGLPLTKALVEANRASFMIKSKKNEGTLVEIAFPPARLLSRDPLSA